MVLSSLVCPFYISMWNLNYWISVGFSIINIKYSYSQINLKRWYWIKIYTHALMHWRSNRNDKYWERRDLPVFFLVLELSELACFKYLRLSYQLWRTDVFFWSKIKTWKSIFPCDFIHKTASIEQKCQEMWQTVYMCIYMQT